MVGESQASRVTIQALQSAADRFNFQLLGECRYGWGGKSAGSAAVGLSVDDRVWLRVTSRAVASAPWGLWTGVADASRIEGVAKPRLLSQIEWREGDLVWRADVESFVSDPVCSTTPELREQLLPSAQWFASLRRSLESLQRYHTTRVNTRQDLITRRIREYFGQRARTNVEKWTTVHGDVHWANLTHPCCWILDWEGWGSGPFGLDAAFLLCFSLLQPATADLVRRAFADWLDPPDGRLSQLLACAELIRMSDMYGDHEDLRPLLVGHAERLLAGRS